MTTNYEYDYIAKHDINENYICELCKNPFVDPFVTLCVHTFCQQCIEQHLVNNSSCPADRCGRALCINDVKEVEPGVIHAVLNRLRVKCRLCTQINICRADFDKHIKEDCTKVIIGCPTKNIGCQWRGHRDQLNDHLETCLHKQLSSTFEKLHDEMQRQKTELEERMTQQKTQLEERIARLEERLNQQRIQLEERMDQQNIRLQEVQNKNQSQNEELARAEEAIIKLNNRLIPLPLCPSLTNISPNTKWKKDGHTVTGQNPSLSHARGLCVDDERTVYVADCYNYRIVAWKYGETDGQVVAGGHRSGNGAHQLDSPTDVIVDKETDSLIICDRGNRRLVRWPRRNGAKGETIISDITCYNLTMDGHGSLYVSDIDKHEVRQYRKDELHGRIVAGGKGRGNRLDQLDEPGFIFVDQNNSVFVSDGQNHRVMEWTEGAKEGIVVAGGQGLGSSLSQLHRPTGILVDQLGTVYVADWGNHRIVRWTKEAKEGNVIVGGNGEGAQANQLNVPMGLSFDRDGHLYVVDSHNKRVQQFSIEIPSNGSN